MAILHRKACSARHRNLRSQQSIINGSGPAKNPEVESTIRPSIATEHTMKTLLLDNYDSFTYNLFQLLADIQQQEPDVVYNDALSFEDLCLEDYDNIVISPGPGHPDVPEDIGICRDIILNSTLPILGICLGQQAIYSAFGGSVIQAPQPVHGQVSRVQHQGDALFATIPTTFQATRYHSLICAKPKPNDLVITAQTLDGTVMGIRHRHRPIWGVQYHPESIMSEYGQQLLRNFKYISERYHAQRSRRPPKQTLKHRHMDTPPPCVILPILSTLKTVGELHLTLKPLTLNLPAETVFARLFAQDDYAIWLDSSQVIPGFSRFSYMGSAQGPLSYRVEYNTVTRTTTVIKGEQRFLLPVSIFDYLKQQLQQITIPPMPHLPFEFQGGLIGYFGYELNQETAPIIKANPSPHPDAHFLFIDRYVVFDHQEHTCYLAALSSMPSDPAVEAWFAATAAQLIHAPPRLEPVPKRSNTPPMGTWHQAEAAYLQHIQACIDFIHTGNSYEVCLTNKLQFNVSCDPWQYYQLLRQRNPAPHSAYLKLGSLGIACSSMERFLYLDRHNTLHTKPIKGTTPRASSVTEDKAQALRLKNETKYRSEHLMIVDLLRNDFGKVCTIGSVHVPELMQVESYSTVHQLVSLIQGNLKPEYNIVDCIKHVFPGGSMTGAPKIRTMNFINQLEQQARGIYSGAIGYLSISGTADFNIVIRTAEITPQQLTIGAGGAIIALSDPLEELQEMCLKTQGLQATLDAL